MTILNVKPPKNLYMLIQNKLITKPAQLHQFCTSFSLKYIILYYHVCISNVFEYACKILDCTLVSTISGLIEISELELGTKRCK